MKCLRCGHCCINYDVIIIDDPEKGVTEDNLIHKKSGDRCQHLRGDKPGEYSCAVHHYPWYKETPCFEFTQVEREDSNCRMGEYVLSNKAV